MNCSAIFVVFGFMDPMPREVDVDEQETTVNTAVTNYCDFCLHLNFATIPDCTQNQAACNFHSGSGASQVTSKCLKIWGRNLPISRIEIFLPMQVRLP